MTVFFRNTMVSGISALLLMVSGDLVAQKKVGAVSVEEHNKAVAAVLEETTPMLNDEFEKYQNNYSYKGSRRYRYKGSSRYRDDDDRGGRRTKRYSRCRNRRTSHCDVARKRSSCSSATSSSCSKRKSRNRFSCGK